jgi:hypothetical protein
MYRTSSARESCENALKILVEKSESKGPLARPRRKVEDDIKFYLKYVVRMWSGSVSLRTGTSGGNKPSGSIKCMEFLD